MQCMGPLRYDIHIFQCELLRNPNIYTRRFTKQSLKYCFRSSNHILKMFLVMNSRLLGIMPNAIQMNTQQFGILHTATMRSVHATGQLVALQASPKQFPLSESPSKRLICNCVTMF